ncbi:MAG TPA: hypothetical protein DIC34_12480 [Treponema sp.]|nr:MAG: hypothetical protein A2001_08315 [Treponema sp. GWC1_61_84]HCM27340.1 hypothetical protein [Treponema sp.]
MAVLCLGSAVFAQTPQPVFLLRSLADSGPVRNPELFFFLPPDAFLTNDSLPQSIGIESKSPEGAEKAIATEVRWNRQGQLVSFPVMLEAAMAQVSLERDARGFVRSLTLIPAEGEGEESGGDGESGFLAGFLLDSDGRAEWGTWEDGETRGAFRFAYTFDEAGRELVREYRYDEAGSVVAAFAYRLRSSAIGAVDILDETGNADEIMGWELDGNGRAVLVRNGTIATEAYYDGSGRPVLIRRTDEKAPIHEISFQWNEKGELVRDVSIDAEGKRTERKYAYVRDGKGNWISRSSVEYAERFGALVGTDGPELVRNIRYR